MSENAILIDVVEKAISRVVVNDFEDLQKLVGAPFTYAHTFQNGDSLWVSDTGLVDGTEEAFKIPDGHQPFLGHGVVMGPADHEGETLPVQMGVEDLIGKVEFTTRTALIKEYHKEAQLRETELDPT